MTVLSVELVPRDVESLTKELELIYNHFQQIKTINIPDLLRFEMRSWEGCKYTKQFRMDLIPHIRAIDISLASELPMGQFLLENCISEVLVLTGDPPQDMSRKIYPTTCMDIVKKFKKELPKIKVYCALDPYRKSIREEFEYIKRKIDAGADGFFTQPFFDLRLIEMYAELLEGNEVFWGVSPVISEKSVSYWETKNNVIFPASFKPTMEWNIDFAKKVLDFVKQRNSNIYFMPIRANLYEYLKGILG